MSWVDVPAGSDFTLGNLPYGAFEHRDGGRHLGVAIGDRILDLRALADSGLLNGIGSRERFHAETLNALLSATSSVLRELRARLTDLLALGGDPALRGMNLTGLFVNRLGATMEMPLSIGDYVDFYSSEHHARNLGRIFRPNDEPLLPNWKWMPIGYHGRAGSIVVSDTPIARPFGQRKPFDAPSPVWGPSTMLDFELEIGFFTDADREIFGVVLVNDWSARDVQAWEYQPLGPFLGKSFATTISPWIVTADALAPFRVAPPVQDPPPLPYLRTAHDASYDINLSVELQTEEMRRQGIAPVEITRTNARELYWTFEQQLAHVGSNGGSIRAGDLFASGTISGASPGSYGSLIELSWRGTKPLALPSGEQRSFLQDGDEVTLRGWCERGDLRFGFGECRGRIEPPQVGAGSATQER
jgi:fumarylacetoacetase